MQRRRRRAHPELRSALHRQLPRLPQLLQVRRRLGFRIGGFARTRRGHLTDAGHDREATSRRDDDDADGDDAGDVEGQRGPVRTNAVVVGATRESHHDLKTSIVTFY